LSQEISARGGPVAEAWRKNGKDLGAVSELMLLSRTRALLEEAQRRAAAGKCPFWIEPEEDFKGRQSFRHRFLVAGEGGGRFSVGIENTGTAHAVIGLGAGGAGRILGGYGVSDDFTLLVGGEVALGGWFPGGSTSSPTTSSSKPARSVIKINSPACSSSAPTARSALEPPRFAPSGASWPGRFSRSATTTRSGPPAAT
jgi:hypothetical protein